MHSSSWNSWPFEVVPKTPRAKETSRNISNVFPDSNENGKTYSRDMTKPIGDACRDDGTLKDANEIEWVHSPTKVTSSEPPPESPGTSSDIYVSDNHDLPSIKVSCVLQIWCRNSPATQQKTQIHGVEDPKSEDEITVPQKRKNVRIRVDWCANVTYPLFSKKRTVVSPKRRRSLLAKTKEAQPTLMKLLALKTIPSQSQNRRTRMKE